MKLTLFGKLIVIAALLAAAYFSIRQFAPDLLHKVEEGSGAARPDPPDRAAVPDTRSDCAGLPDVRLLLGASNVQMGLMLAYGGRPATEGSLLCRHRVHLEVVREDDLGKMQASLIAFATELHRGERHPDTGAHFVAIPGDGAAAFLTAVNGQLRLLGPEYQAKVVGSAGTSRGEDKLLGPPGWKETPAGSRGGLVAGVLRDSGWHLVQKWLSDNELCTNPNDKTWDRRCLNWVAAADALAAAQKYISGYCEIRPVVDQGRLTGERRKACVNGVVTRTPGDVTVARKKGGLVSIVSTREPGSQMPNTLIGIDKWMRDNRQTVEGMLSATFQGSDQVRSSYQPFRQAAAVSAEVYREPGAGTDDWEKYFKGVTERDRQGFDIELGGASVNNLEDNLLLFGLVPGSSNPFGVTYKASGDLVMAQYPDLLPSYPPVSEILDTSYLEGIARREAR